MPAFQWTPIAAIKVGLLAGALDPAKTKGYGCQVRGGAGDLGVGVFELTITEAAGTDEVSVQVTPISAPGGLALNSFTCKVSKLPLQTDLPAPFTKIGIELQTSSDGSAPLALTGFMVRVDRVAIGST